MTELHPGLEDCSRLQEELYFQSPRQRFHPHRFSSVLHLVGSLNLQGHYFET